MEIKCAYCGKKLEQTPSRVAVVNRGDNVYCSENCKMRYKAFEKGVTEEVILRKLEEIGSNTTMDYLLKELNVRDSSLKKAVAWLISCLRDSGKISVTNVGDKTIISMANRKREENEMNEFVRKIEEKVEKDRISELERRIDVLSKRIDELNGRMESLVRNLNVIKRAIEVIFKTLSGR